MALFLVGKEKVKGDSHLSDIYLSIESSYRALVIRIKEY